MVAKYAELFMPAEMTVSFLPAFIAKRVFPALYSGRQEQILHFSALNACTGYDYQIATGGLIGIWIFYIFLMTLMYFIVYLIRKRKSLFSSPFYAIMSMQMAFMFFYNTITTAATSWLLIFILMHLFKPNIKLRFGKKHLKMSKRRYRK